MNALVGTVSVLALGLNHLEGQLRGEPITLMWKVPLKSASFGGAAAAVIDGKPVVAFATYFGDARVRVLRGIDGEEVWSHHEGDHCYDASVRFFDLDGDGKLELIAPCSDTSTVFAFDAATGAVKWRRELGEGECIDTPAFVGDVEGDERPEIVVGTFKGKLWVLDADGTVKRSVKVAKGAVQSCPLVLDVDGDGSRDFIAGNFRGDHSMHAVSGAEGDKLWRVKTGEHIYHGPSLARLGEEGTPAIAFGSYDGHVYAADVRTGDRLWKLKTGDRYIMAPTAALDVNGDGRDEIVSTSQRITLISSEGTIRWQELTGPNENTGGTTRGVAIADLDADGELDLAYLDDTGGFHVRRARDGVMIYEFAAPIKAGEPGMEGDHAPVLADLNADGKLDAFYVIGKGSGEHRAGLAIALTGFSGKGEGWRTFRHDTQNSGNVLGPDVMKAR